LQQSLHKPDRDYRWLLTAGSFLPPSEGMTWEKTFSRLRCNLSQGFSFLPLVEGAPEKEHPPWSPLAMGRAGAQPLDSSARLGSPGCPPRVKFQSGKGAPSLEDPAHSWVWAEEETSRCERHWVQGKASKTTAWSPSSLG